MRATAAASDEDRLGDLSDDLLRHVLSFLTPDEALQTCVLHTRWRSLWRRTTSLVLIFDDKRSRLSSSENIQKLAKLIIQLRGNSPLVKCEIDYCPDDDAVRRSPSTYTNAKLLIEYAITCQVNELVVRIGNIEYEPLLFDAPLISQHLKSIQLECADLEFSALDFSGCLVLEDLKMTNCCIQAHKISSNSLKLMCITGGCAIPDDFHIQICAPGLISLQLDDFKGLTPFLEYMPFLVTAYVGLGCECDDICDLHMEACDSPDTVCHAYLVEEGVILKGLFNAVNLELIAEPEMMGFKMVPHIRQIKDSITQ